MPLTIGVTDELSKQHRPHLASQVSGNSSGLFGDPTFVVSEAHGYLFGRDAVRFQIFDFFDSMKSPRQVTFGAAARCLS